MRKTLLLLLAMILYGVNGFAASGNLTVNGAINAGSDGITFKDGSTQKTAAFQVLASGTAYPGTNDYTITIPSTSGKINLSYEITSSLDVEIMLGFNDNLTATGVYAIYAVSPNYPAIAGKVYSGLGRTSSGSAGQYNSFDIIPSGNLILIKGDHISEGNITYWGSSFRSYLKYDSPQTISKLNLKCYNPSANISKITWKVITLP